MHAPHSLAVFAAVSACLVLTACSDSEKSDGANTGQMPSSDSGAPRTGLPAPPPAPPPQLQGINACSVLSATDVQAVIGHAMDGPEAGPTAGGGRGEGKMSSCSFASRSDSENAAPAELLAELNSTWFVTVNIWVWPEGGEGARNYINAMRDAPMTDKPVRTVEGLADEAVWNGALHARQGNTTVSLDVRPAKSADQPGELEKERKLMEQALQKL